MKLILASASPRRAEILLAAHIAFETRPTLVDESLRAGETPGDYVGRLALAKARAAAGEQTEGGDFLFLGADTVVVAAGEILGKPSSEEDARRMLRLLAGRVHEVHTGVALLRRRGGDERVAEEVTHVTFAPLTEDEIGRYVTTGEPFGKAGAYAIQGIGGRYVSRVEGCYFNVVGLPLARLWGLLRESGWEAQIRT
jgi:septum formation protein